MLHRKEQVKQSVTENKRSHRFARKENIDAFVLHVGDIVTRKPGNHDKSHVGCILRVTAVHAGLVYAKVLLDSEIRSITGNSIDWTGHEVVLSIPSNQFFRVTKKHYDKQKSHLAELRQQLIAEHNARPYNRDHQIDGSATDVELSHSQGTVNLTWQQYHEVLEALILVGVIHASKTMRKHSGCSLKAAAEIVRKIDALTAFSKVWEQISKPLMKKMVDLVNSNDLDPGDFERLASELAANKNCS
tara:strand:- start:1531 stop:2265 length:735 start_codon:yes stop_codon:yes gene_type:complete